MPCWRITIGAVARELVSPYGGKSDWVDYLGLKGFAPNFKTQFPVIGIARYRRFWSGGAESVERFAQRGICRHADLDHRENTPSSTESNT